MNDHTPTIAELQARVSKLESEASNRAKIDAQRDSDYAKMKQAIDLLKQQMQNQTFNRM